MYVRKERLTYGILPEIYVIDAHWLHHQGDIGSEFLI
jgi:hypothetical protein